VRLCLIVWRKGRLEGMDKYLYWLDNVLYLGDTAKRKLINTFQTGEAIYRAEEKVLKKILDDKKVDLISNSRKAWDLDKKYEEVLNGGIHMVILGKDSFPSNLQNISDPPFALYYKGRLPEEGLPSVAVIGARQCSEYGRYIAMELGKCLGENNIQVISGMASGIDGISQYSASQAGGRSFGVLGCGVDVCYPRSNWRLYDELVDSGGILSSYPPGTQPLKQFFPPRNRIVSGLADVIVVIEARQKSGTSITVEMALEQGKDIYAVPGRITDRLSDGCNKMLREGAHVFLSPQDFLQELQQLLPGKMTCALGRKRKELLNVEGRCKVSEDKNDDGLEADEEYKKVLEVLDFYPQYVDAIADRLKKEQGFDISPAKLNTLLIQMCLSDIVKQESAGWFSKVSMEIN